MFLLYSTKKCLISTIWCRCFIIYFPLWVPCEMDNKQQLFFLEVLVIRNCTIKWIHESLNLLRIWEIYFISEFAQCYVYHVCLSVHFCFAFSNKYVSDRDKAIVVSVVPMVHNMRDIFYVILKVERQSIFVIYFHKEKT